VFALETPAWPVLMPTISTVSTAGTNF
jgi:hypothetical protein